MSINPTTRCTVNCIVGGGTLTLLGYAHITTHSGTIALRNGSVQHKMLQKTAMAREMGWSGVKRFVPTYGYHAYQQSTLPEDDLGRYAAIQIDCAIDTLVALRVSSFNSSANRAVSSFRSNFRIASRSRSGRAAGFRLRS